MLFQDFSLAEPVTWKLTPTDAQVAVTPLEATSSIKLYFIPTQEELSGARVPWKLHFAEKEIKTKIAKLCIQYDNLQSILMLLRNVSQITVDFLLAEGNNLHDINRGMKIPSCVRKTL